MGNEQLKRGMWEFFTLVRAEVRKILADASLEKQEGIQRKSKESGYRLSFPNDAARLPCNDERQLGRIPRKIQEGRKVIGVDPRKNTRSLQEIGKG